MATKKQVSPDHAYPVAICLTCEGINCCEHPAAEDWWACPVCHHPIKDRLRAQKHCDHLLAENRELLASELAPVKVKKGDVYPNRMAMYGSKQERFETQ